MGAVENIKLENCYEDDLTLSLESGRDLISAS